MLNMERDLLNRWNLSFTPKFQILTTQVLLESNPTHFHVTPSRLCYWSTDYTCAVRSYKPLFSFQNTQSQSWSQYAPMISIDSKISLSSLHVTCGNMSVSLVSQCGNMCIYCMQHLTNESDWHFNLAR